MVENPKLEVMLQYKNLSYKLLTLAPKKRQLWRILLVNALNSVSPRLEVRLNRSTSAPMNQVTNKKLFYPDVQQTTGFLIVAQLKKKNSIKIQRETKLGLISYAREITGQPNYHIKNKRSKGMVQPRNSNMMVFHHTPMIWIYMISIKKEW